jgi:hypothetical protein
MGVEFVGDLVVGEERDDALDDLLLRLALRVQSAEGGKADRVSR